MKAIVFGTLLVSLSQFVCATDNSIEVTLEDGPRQQSLLSPEQVAQFKEWQSKDFPAKMKAAAARGERAAKKDIKANRLRLRDCGEPRAKQETDTITGYRIERIGPCGQLNMEMEAEARAYNRTVLAWHERHSRSR